MIFIFFISSLFNFQSDLESIFCLNKWEAEYIKLYSGEKFSDIHSPPLSTSDSPPECGQIITFKNDHTCSVQYKGAGLWSQIDQYNWSIEKAKKIIFKKIGKGATDKITLTIQTANQDSIILFSGPMIGIETGKKAFSVYKLKRKD